MKMNIKPLRKRFSTLLLRLLTILAPLPWGGVGGGLLCACGDFFQFDSGDLQTAANMQLDRQVVTLVVGDHYCIPVSFAPDALTNSAVYWESMDDAVATFVDDTLVARSAGLTRAIAFSAIDRLRDTCWVQVLPEMYVAPGSYPYETMIYASVDIHGQRLTMDNQDAVVIGAYVGDELRGIGRMKQERGIDYMALRVYSPAPYGDLITLRCYFRGQARAELFPDTLLFDGDHYGSLSRLYPLVLDDDAAVYTPDVESLSDGDVFERPDTIELDPDDPE